MSLNICEKKEKFINIKNVYKGCFQVTEGVKNILEERNGITYIPFSEIENLMGEFGGSPFTYTYKYSDRFGSEWTVDKTSEGSYYLGEDLDSFDEYELFNMVNENLNLPNFGEELSERIGIRCLDLIEDSYGKWKRHEADTVYFIPFQLLELYIVTQYDYVINILFHKEEFEQLQYLIDC